jgi:stage II sporulation protein M
MAALFMLGAVAGILVPQQAVKAVLESLRDMAKQMGLELPLTPFLLMLIILANNLRVSLLIVISGIVVIGPSLIVFVNGVIISAVYLYASSATSPLTAFLSILPHGIIEIPAILNIAASSTIFWLSVWRRILKGVQVDLGKEAITLLKHLALTVVLLFLAAAVEAFITPRIANLPIYTCALLPPHPS